MSIPSPNELLAYLNRSQLLSASQVESLSKELGRFASGEQLVADLVGRGWLTPFQQKWIIEGEGDKLVVGPFRLLEPIGEGGMGVVYKALHPRLDRIVALKLIRPQVLAVKPDVVARFQREARAIAQLHHPNVVMLFDADEIDGTHFLAMEYAEGVTLEKMVRLNGPLAVRQACDYVRQSALGLQHAHECGMVHRDIKPSNILVTQKVSGGGGTGRSSVMLKRPALVTPRDKQLAGVTGGGKSGNNWGLVKILDMGLARLQESLEEANANPETPLTRAGALLGTPDFISPEQARDARTVDIRSDLYALGCTFYYILTGRPPFPGGTEVQKLLRHQTEMPMPLEELRPHLPSAVVAIAMRLIQKRPQERYQTPQEVADDLTDYLNSAQEGRSAPANLPPSRAESPRTLDEAPPQSTQPPHDSQDGPRTVVREMGAADTPQSAFETMMVDHVGPAIDASNRLITQAHTGVVGAVAVAPDGKLIATGGLDGLVRLWNLSDKGLKDVASLPRPGTEIQTLAFAPDEPYLVVGGTRMGNAFVWRWDWNEGRVFDWGGFATTAGRGIGASVFAADGKAFAATVSAFVVHWKISGRNASARSIIKGHSRPLLALDFSPDRRLLASAGEGKAVRFWGFGWLGASLRSRVEGHTDSITSLHFSPDGKHLASASLDRSIMLWDAANPSPNTARVFSGHTGGLRLVRFLPDGQRLISVADGGQVFYWDMATGVKLMEFQVALGIASGLTLTPDARKLVVGTSDGKLAIFELEHLAAGSPTMNR